MARTIQEQLIRAFPGTRLQVEIDARGILTLRGACDTWQQVVAIGHRAAKLTSVSNVVNELTPADVQVPKKNYSALHVQGEAKGLVAEVDVLIVGAGVCGCAVARELAKYDLSILVAEMGDDVAVGATKANNGNIHPGHAVKPGTLKAKLNVEGNRMYDAWAAELGFTLQRCGAMGFITNPLLKAALYYSYRRAKKNGVDGVELVSGKRACELEPGLVLNGYQGKVKAALWLPSMALVEPHKVTVALAENAALNGVRFWLNTTVAAIQIADGAVSGAVTSRGIVRARYIINCAGLHADEISAMAGDKCYTIHPRKGVIALLDKAQKPIYESLCEYITFEDIKQALKNPETKGGGMCRTPEGNILMGPSAMEIPDKEDLSVTPEELKYAMSRGDKNITYSNIIRYFAGNRPADYKEDFVIAMSEVTDGFINVGAIQSPGLAAAPAIAQMVEKILIEDLKQKGNPLTQKTNWQPRRNREVEFRHLNRKQQDELIRSDPRYGRVVCRCENITEGEILDALHSPVPPTSIDAIKRRTRAGMGRCQGGFCQPRVIELMAREIGKEWTEITLKGEGTNILTRQNREKVTS